MEILKDTLRSKKVGYGHFNISIELDGQTLSTTTTNTKAIDAALDNCYDDQDRSGSYYESQEQAQQSLVDEILRDNDTTR